MSFVSNTAKLALLMSAGLLLSACDTIREATGSTKTAPDEFAVVTKAPLILPPEYNLRPPQPGAAPLNQSSPTATAATALYGADTMTVANSMSGTLSSGERLLLAHASAHTASPAIRQQLSSDTRNMQGADDSFTKDILFWQQQKPNTGTAVDANAEASRLESARANGGAPLPPGAQPAPSAAPAPQAPAEKKDEGGWFDWF